MFATARRWSVLVAFSLAAPLRAASGPWADLVRIKPSASRVVAVSKWEVVSKADDGRRRYGGSDRRSFVFSPDGKRLLTADGSGWKFECWDIDSGKSLGKFGRIQDHLSLAFFPDGKRFVVVDAEHSVTATVEVWDVETRKRVRNLDQDVNVIPFQGVAISPDGKTLALAGLKGIGQKPVPVLHFWDVASGDEVRVTEGPALPVNEQNRNSPDRLAQTCFAPDGKALAAVLDQKIVLLEAATGQERCVVGMPLHSFAEELDYSPSFPAPLTFSPDGRMLAAGCDDGAVRLWDAHSGHEYAPLVGHAGPVRCLLFTRDGQALLSFGSDDKVLTWPVDKLKLDWLPKRDKLDAQELTALWETLSGDDVLARYAAVRVLAAAPVSTLPFLRQHVKTASQADVAKVRKLIAELGQADFNERKKTVLALGQHVDLAVPILMGTRRTTGDDQKGWFNWYHWVYPTKGHLRDLQALDVLESMDAPGARQLLKELSEGAVESLLTRQASAVLGRMPQQRPVAGRTPEALWEDLASEDTRRAYTAQRVLAARPRDALPLLHERLKRVAALDAFDDDLAHVPRLISRLDADDFAVREQAQKDLARFGKRAGALLRAALRTAASAESKQRLEELLKGVGNALPSRERLQIERALETLEHTGTDEARRVLESLRDAAKSRALEEEIAAALRRLEK